LFFVSESINSILDMNCIKNYFCFEMSDSRAGVKRDDTKCANYILLLRRIGGRKVAKWWRIA